MLPENLNLTPFWGTILVFLAVVSGHLYKKNWKQEGPLWKAWLYGCLAGGALLTLAFVPLKSGSWF